MKNVCVKQSNRGPGKGRTHYWACTINRGLFSGRENRGDVVLRATEVREIQLNTQKSFV